MQEPNASNISVQADSGVSPVRAFLTWAWSSARGHVAFFSIVFSVPELLLSLTENYSEGTLTVSWALYSAVAVFALGAILALLIWYTITRPYRRRLANRS